MSLAEIERHPGNPVAVTDDHYLARIPVIAEQLAKSNMCPEQFKGKPADIAVAGYGLADNGIRLSFSTLAQVYVVKGRPGYMAQIQSSMAALHGIDVHPVDELCDDKSATVEITTRNGRQYRVSFTMAEAVTAKLADKDMYKQWPANMLVARATTRAIDRHCPAVKLGLAGSINMAELGAGPAPDQGAPGDESVAPTVSTAQEPARTESLQVPPMSLAPDGHTIPEDLREPAIDNEFRQQLIDTLESLPDPVAEHVKEAARELGMPNLRSSRVTKAHGALVQRLMAEAVAATGEPAYDVEEQPAFEDPDEEPF